MVLINWAVDAYCGEQFLIPKAPTIPLWGLDFLVWVYLCMGVVTYFGVVPYLIFLFDLTGTVPYCRSLVLSKYPVMQGIIGTEDDERNPKAEMSGEASTKDSNRHQTVFSWLHKKIEERDKKDC